MKMFKQGDVVKLSKAGAEYLKKRWEDEFAEDPEDFPFGGELGVISRVFEDDEPYNPGMIYVEWPSFGEYLKPEQILLGTDFEFPAKVKAYEVRIGDVVKDFEGDKMRVHCVNEEDDGNEILFIGGITISNGRYSFTYRPPQKKIKVFSREYK